MSKTVLVTGASSGIGKATALHLIEEGHTVYGAARRVEKMQDIVRLGGKALELDVTDHGQIKEVVSNVIENEGRIDALVNNAGYAVYGPIEETSYEKAKQQFEVNLFGLAEITKAVLPLMRKSGSGTIVNVSSMGGKIYTPLMGWYGATKFALEGWSDILRLEVKQFGIRVVIIEPGAVKSELAGNTLAQSENVPDSPYAELKNVMETGLANTFDPNAASDPIVVAEVVAEAITSESPETRYAVGHLAKEMIAARESLSDEEFDEMIMGQLAAAAKQN